MRSPGRKKCFRRSRSPALPMNLRLHLCPKMSRYRFAPCRFPVLPIERTLTDFARSSCWYPKSRFSPYSKLRSTLTRSGNHRSSQNRPRASCPPGHLAARPNPGSLGQPARSAAGFAPRPWPCVVSMTNPALTATATSADTIDTAITPRCMRLSCSRFSRTCCAVMSPASDLSPR